MTPRFVGPRPLAVACGVLVVALALTYRLGSPPLFDDPNDAQYAEVAREMVESGEWISPQLNYVLFLNKPPLLYWMIAVSYAICGVQEAAARLPGTLMTLLTVVLVYYLGRELSDATTGLLAATVYAGMAGTILEARFVRPDVLLTASTTAAILAAAVLWRTPGRSRRAACIALYVALAVGVMAKGIVGVVLPGVPIALALLVERRADLLARLAAPRHWLWFVLLVVPWHVVAALRHPGFLWDYVVNQHLLFFFDQKLPRDSVPVSLSVFWAAFLLRMFPWTLFLPLALVRFTTAGRNARPVALLLLAWGGTVLAFFSAASSRLEHYALPALPAVALLIGSLLRHWSDVDRAWQRLLRAHLAPLLGIAIAGLWWVPTALTQVDMLSAAGQLSSIARLFFGVLAIASAIALMVVRRYPMAPAPLLSGAILALTPVMHWGMAQLAPSNSSAPIAAMLQAAGADGAEIVFEAPVEYQQCAGLNFYLRRKLAILRPAGFVDPTYLRPHADQLFIDRTRLAQMWQTERVLFVSDPLAPPSRSLAAVIPGPFSIVGRSGTRWVLRNRIP